MDEPNDLFLDFNILKISDNKKFMDYFRYLSKFKIPIDEACKLYIEQLPIQNESWENCDFSILDDKLRNNFLNYEYDYEPEKSLLDIINLSMMIYLRIRRKHKIKENNEFGKIK